MSNDHDTFHEAQQFSKEADAGNSPFPASDYLRTNVPARRVCFNVFFNRGLSHAEAAAATEHPAPKPSANDVA
jgi:hypothetical protein